MTDQDRDAIVAVAIQAALADGQASDAERRTLAAVAAGLGVKDVEGLVARAAGGHLDPAEAAGRLGSEEARRAAHETAVAVCLADGPAGPGEQRFLEALRQALRLDPEAARQVDARADAIAAAAGATVGAAAPAGAPPSPGDQGAFIERQAMIAAALELLPERLSTMAVLPLQAHMVYKIGQASGHALDARQVAELGAAVGLGAAGQAVERAVSGLLGRLGRGLLGGLVGGAAGLASSAAVTFVSTWALGHVAQRYYAGGRTLSRDDLRGLFAQLQAEGRSLWPRVEGEVQRQARTLDVRQLLDQAR